MALDSSPFLENDQNCSSVNDSFGVYLANATPNSQVRKLKEKVKLWKGRYKSLREKSLPRAAARIAKNKVLGGKRLYLNSPKVNLTNFYRLKYLRERQNNQEFAETLASERNECTKLFEASLSHQRDFMALQQGIEQAVSDRVVEVLTELATPLKAKVHDILDNGKSQVDLMIRDMLSALGNGASYTDEVVEGESRQLTPNTLPDIKTQRSPFTEMTEGNSDRNNSSVNRSRCRVLPMVMGHVLQKPKLALPKMDLHEIQRRNRELRQMEQVPDMSLIDEASEDSPSNNRTSSESINDDNLSLAVSEDERRSFLGSSLESDTSTSIDESPRNEQRSFLAPLVTRMSRRNVQSSLSLKLRPQILLSKVDSKLPNSDLLNVTANSPSDQISDLTHPSLSSNGETSIDLIEGPGESCLVHQEGPNRSSVDLQDVPNVSRTDPLEGPSWMYRSSNTTGQTSDKPFAGRSSISRNLKKNSRSVSNGIQIPMVQIHTSVDDMELDEASEKESIRNILPSKSKRISSKGNNSSLPESSVNRKGSLRKSQVAPMKVNSPPKPAPRLSKKKSDSDTQIKSSDSKLRESCHRENGANQDESSILRSAEENTNINGSNGRLSVLVTVPDAQSSVTNFASVKEDSVDNFKVPNAITRRKKSSTKNSKSILKKVETVNHTLLFENEPMEITVLPEADKEIKELPATSNAKLNDEIRSEENALFNEESVINKDPNFAKIFNLSLMEETAYTIEPFRTKCNVPLSGKRLSIVLTDCLKEVPKDSLTEVTSDEKSLTTDEDLENDLNGAAVSSNVTNIPKTLQKNVSKRVSFHASVPSGRKDSVLDSKPKRSRKSLKDPAPKKIKKSKLSDVIPVKSRRRVAVILTSDSDSVEEKSEKEVNPVSSTDSPDYEELPTKRKSRRSRMKLVDASSLKKRRTGQNQMDNVDNGQSSDEDVDKFDKKLRKQARMLKDSNDDEADLVEIVNGNQDAPSVLDVVAPSNDKPDDNKVSRKSPDITASLLELNEENLPNSFSPNEVNDGKNQSTAKVKKLRRSEYFESLALSSDDEFDDNKLNSRKSGKPILEIEVDEAASETNTAANCLKENDRSSSVDTEIFEEEVLPMNGTESQFNLSGEDLDMPGADAEEPEKTTANSINLAELENVVDDMIVDREESEELPDITIEKEVTATEAKAKKNEEVKEEPILSCTTNDVSSTQVGDDSMANGDTGGHHPRRAARSRVVSYKEPNLMSKLRKGDSSSDASSNKTKKKRKRN